MRLIGIYLSPFVRRVAVSLSLLQLPFDFEDVFVFGERDTVRRYNPLVRIPILALDNGENLVESGAILDEIDQMVAPERRLTPSEGPLRRPPPLHPLPWQFALAGSFLAKPVAGSRAPLK